MSKNVDIEQMKKAVYESVAKLKEYLECDVYVNTGTNYFDIIIPIDDFIKALIRKIKSNVNKDVLRKVNIMGTRVHDFMVLRLQVLKE